MKTTVSPTAAIALNNLSKQYSGTKDYALRNVSLQVMSGEVYGFLGSNGAGKSTTIRCLLNFIQPTTGSASVLGQDIVTDSVKVKSHIGYLPGDVSLYRGITGQQFLAYMASLQPLKRPGYLKVLTRTFRAELNKPLEQLSKGNRQKIGIIQAFMHEPEVLILDEPTSGLDPLMQEEFFKLVRECKARGATVFLSSHDFAEVQRMCDRVGFLRDGKLVSEQTIADLVQKAAHTYDITFAGEPPIAELKRIKNAVVEPHNEHHARVSLEGELTPLFRVLARYHVLRMDQQEVDLQDQFLRFYGEEES
ncbi:MAG TPA: ABC transporter ATP-binding protein [Patescibacteria group bacterium]|nr:ABC transporter ATP-binding protein [Patescibacteria group bacterium]